MYIYPLNIADTAADDVHKLIMLMLAQHSNLYKEEKR
jgi:hypothetical protein